eukprot:s4923_g2.t1
MSWSSCTVPKGLALRRTLSRLASTCCMQRHARRRRSAAEPDTVPENDSSPPSHGKKRKPRHAGHLGDLPIPGVHNVYASRKADSSAVKRNLEPILESRAEQAEPVSKKGKHEKKAKRYWGSKKWSKELEQTASTPIKPTGVKSPDIKRNEVQTTQTQTEIDKSSEENLQQKLADAENEIGFLLKDAQKMWKNQTWYNHQLIAMQNKEAAQQYIFTGWTDTPRELLCRRQRQNYLLGPAASRSRALCH